jgi:hypothetical protein
VLLLAIPAVSLGASGAWDMLWKWKDALVAKGFPMESHNQSFAAMMYHFFSGAPTHLIFEGPQWRVLGPGGMSEQVIELVAIAWGLATTGILLGWLLNGSKPSPLRWLSVALALLIVPSHLVWKPYFVMGLPVAILAWHQAIVDLRQESANRLILVLIALVGMNLTSFDIVGGWIAAWAEAGSLMLFMHLILVAMVAQAPTRA